MTHLSYGGIFNDSIITKCSPDSDSELSLKISPYLMKLRHIKLRRTKKCASFLGHPVVESKAGSHNSCGSESGQNCFAFSKVIAEIKAIILTRCWCFTAVLCVFTRRQEMTWRAYYTGDRVTVETLIHSVSFVMSSTLRKLSWTGTSRFWVIISAILVFLS